MYVVMESGALGRHTKYFAEKKSEFVVRELVTIADFFHFTTLQHFSSLLLHNSQYNKKM